MPAESLTALKNTYATVKAIENWTGFHKLKLAGF